MSYNTRKKLKGTFFILPAFLIHVIVIVIPALSMIYYAFTKWNGLSEPVFIGLDNFKRMLKDYDFLFAMKNNLIWMDRSFYPWTGNGLSIYQDRKSANDF